MEQRFATQLAILPRRWRLLGNQALAQLGVSDASGWCLVYMQRLGEGASQSDLARAVGVSEPTLVRTLNGLEVAGLVERTPHPLDARAKIARLTAKGCTLASAVEESLRQLRSELLVHVPDEDLAAAVRVQEALSATLTAKRERP